MKKIPCNRSDHSIHTFAEQNEHQAFKQQAKLDLSSFIEHRSRELVPGSILILSIPSIDHQGIVSIGEYIELIYSCGQSFFNTKELWNFTIPVCARSLSECVDHM